MKKIFLLLAFVCVACEAPSSSTIGNREATPDSAGAESPGADSAQQPGGAIKCDDSLILPAGFCAEIFHDGVGKARHLAVRDNGDVYVARRGDDGGLVALRDADNDGRAEIVAPFGKRGGTAAVIYGEYLYFSTTTEIWRYRLAAGVLVPTSDPELMVSGFDPIRMHAAKALAFDNEGHMYVNIGAPSNACQNPSRTPGVPGQDPCPLLERFGGVWRYLAERPDQEAYGDGVRFATGIRNGLAMSWNPFDRRLYLVQHGRDQLHELWPEQFTEQQRAELPAEQFFAVGQGDNFGWPYCYYDHRKELKLLNPEYGGDGNIVGRCKDYKNPIAAYPGHWAPNDLVFYAGEAFPAGYREGAFIAFHGSWNRAPFPQQGYQLVFQPMKNGQPFGSYEAFATGFTGAGEIMSPGEARFRPTGLAVDGVGRLYVSDSREGRIWRVSYQD